MSSSFIDPKDVIPSAGDANLVVDGDNVDKMDTSKDNENDWESE